MTLFKNIAKKRDLRENILHTTQSTFITELQTDAVHDMKKLINSTTVVSINIHLHPQTSYTKLFIDIYIILYNILTNMSCT